MILFHNGTLQDQRNSPPCFTVFRIGGYVGIHFSLLSLWAVLLFQSQKKESKHLIDNSNWSLDDSLYCILQGIFDRFDRDRSGKIDSTELRDALLSLGYAVSPAVLDLLVSKFDKTGGKSKAVEYDNFIE